MFLDTRPNSRISTSTISNGIHNELTSDALSSLTAGSLPVVVPSPTPTVALAPGFGSSNVTDIDSVMTKATAFRRFKSKLVKKKEKTGNGSGSEPIQDKGNKGSKKPYEETVPGSAAGCSHDVAEKLVVVIPENKPCSPLISEKEQSQEQSDSASGSDVAATKLAHRIQTLLSSSCNPSHLFPFSNPTSSTATDVDESTAVVVQEETTPSSQQQQSPNNNDSRFKLVPDSLFKMHLTDTKFMNLLTTSNILPSGTKSNSDSLHDVLDKWTRFVIRKHHPGSTHQKPESESDEHDNDTGEDSDSDSSSVVLSCPLEPTSETKVEIARSEVISVDLDADPSIQSSNPQSFLSSDRSGFWSSFSKTTSQNTAVDSNTPSPSKSSRLKEIRVWYPSRTNVSLEATWWGYRIYLPPPVMQILSDKTLEAAKRAAMITAALTWLVSRIPLEVLPPQFKPLTLILKEIVPLIGYVGGFIAWSWNTVKGFDKGDGVVLSATWLLPIALIPGTWIYTEPNFDIPLENFFDGRPPTTATPSSLPPPPPPPPKDTSSTTSKSVFTSVSGLTRGGPRRRGSLLRQV